MVELGFDTRVFQEHFPLKQQELKTLLQTRYFSIHNTYSLCYKKIWVFFSITPKARISLSRIEFAYNNKQGTNTNPHRPNKETKPATNTQAREGGGQQPRLPQPSWKKTPRTTTKVAHKDPLKKIPKHRTRDPGFLEFRTLPTGQQGV